MTRTGKVTCLENGAPGTNLFPLLDGLPGVHLTSRRPSPRRGRSVLRFCPWALFIAISAPCPRSHAAGIYVQPIIEDSPMIKRGHLEGGVNGDAAPRKDGKTPLMLAVEAHQIDVIDYLLEHGADPTLKDAAGETALDIAKRVNTDDITIKLAQYAKDHPEASIYYAAHPAELFVVSGNNQVGAPDCGGPQSMIVYAMDKASGRPLADAPVRFAVEGGGAHLVTQASSPDSPTLLLRTDEYGICKANLHLPATPNTSIRIDATAGSGPASSRVFFTARTNDGTTGGSVSCFNPSDESVVVNPDNTVTVTWKNNTDDETMIRIWVDTPHGMRAVLTVPAHSTTARLPLQ